MEDGLSGRSSHVPQKQGGFVPPVFFWGRPVPVGGIFAGPITQERVNRIQAMTLAADRSRQSGFTLVELVMTIIIIGILAAIAVPRFFDEDVFQSRGFAEQVKASLRYAQKVAIAQRRNACVAFTANSMTLTIASVAGPASPCDTALQSPTGDPGYVVTAPANVNFTVVPTDFRFTALGVASISQTINISGVANGITIEPVTGYAHQ